MKIRLYRKTDRDLMCLYKNPSFSLVRALSKTVEMCAKHEYAYIYTPECKQLSAFPKKIELEIPLSSEGKKWIKQVPNGEKNDTIKQIFRCFLTGPVLNASHPEKIDMDFFNSEKKPIIQCLKRESDIRSEHDQELQQLKALLNSKGKTPSELIRLLEKQDAEMEKQEIKENQKSVSLAPEQAEVKTRQKTSPEPIVPQNKIETKEEVDTESGFDLMAAIGQIMD